MHLLRQVQSDILVFIVPHVCKTLQMYEKPYDLCTEIMMTHIKTSGVINEEIRSGECGSSFLSMFIDFSTLKNITSLCSWSGREVIIIIVIIIWKFW